MNNRIDSFALVVDFINKADLETLTELLEQIEVKHKSLFSREFVPINDKLASWTYHNWANVKTDSIEKLKKSLYLKKNSNDKSFRDEEIQSIFSSSDEIKFDLIIVASESRQSLEDNFLLNANYAEIYFANKAFNKDFFDINEVMSAIDFFNATQRNFGS